MKEALARQRAFLKDNIRLEIDFTRTDQSKGLPPPPVEKPFSPDGTLVDLSESGTWKGIAGADLASAVERRRSHRHFLGDPLSLDELAFLLWATQGIRQVLPSGSAQRTVPSAGCRHALETYLCVMKVDGLDPGMYRFLPVENKLLLERAVPGLNEKIVTATLGQQFTGKAAAVFVWTALPYRMEWRYDLAAHKVILLDAGHVCQNLYLACEAIGAGTCAIAAYHQKLMDELVGVDGEEEFTIYLAPVGKVPQGEQTS